MPLFKRTLLFASILAFLPMLNGYAQDAQKVLDEVYQKIECEQYEEANTLLCSINDTQITTLSDSLKYYSFKGTCLRLLFRYEKAIPFLKKVIHLTEKRPEYFVDYIRSLYWLGNCYINQEQYDKAERFLRKVMIKDNEDACKCNTLALYNLTVIYNKQGYTVLENECVDRIRTGIVSDSLATWKDKVSNLGGLALWLYSNHLNEKADSILKERIKIGSEIGRKDKTYDIWICCAYVEYLILMARKNEVDKVRDLLQDAKEYFRKTQDFEFNNEVLCILYDMIGYAFDEAGNLNEGERYHDESERY